MPQRNLGRPGAKRAAVAVLALALAFAPMVVSAAALLGEPTVDRPSQGFDNEWCASEIYAFQGQFVPDGPEVTLNFVAQNWIDPVKWRNERIDNVYVVDASITPIYFGFPDPAIRDAYFCVADFFQHFFFHLVPPANVAFSDRFDTGPDPRWNLGDARWIDGDTAPRTLAVPVDSTGGSLALADSTNPAAFINASILIEDLVPGNTYELFVWSRPGLNQGEDLQVEIFGTEWYSDETDDDTADPSSTEAVAWADADQDGDHDLWSIHGAGDNRFWRNDGGSLVEVAGAIGLRGTPADRSIAFADTDNDGDLDAYLGVAGANQFKRNDGGTYFDVTAGPLGDALDSRGVGFVDFNSDGLVDLYVPNSNGPNVLLKNTGGNTFSDATSPGLDEPADTRDAAWADFDADGDADCFLVNSGFPNQLWRNDGGGNFVDVAPAMGGGLADPNRGRSAIWEDLDGDLDLDLAVANSLNFSFVYRNDGGSFRRFALPLAPAGSVSLTATDYDRDGDLDLYDGRLDAANQLLRNDGHMLFSPVATGVVEDAGTVGGVAWGDFNGDGDEDAYVGNVVPKNALFQNEQGQKRAWLQVDLIGTLSNRSAVGARLELTDGGVTLLRHVQASGGGTSHSALTVEFARNALRDGEWDRLDILWPSGVQQTLTGLPRNQRITVVEPGVVDVPWASVRPTALRLAPIAPNPLRGSATIEFALPTPGAPSLRIYDATGRLVQDLGGVTRGAGTHRVGWNARDRAGSAVAAGVYFVELRHRGERQVQRIVRTR